MLVSINVKKQTTFIENVESALLNGFIVIPWRRSNTAQRHIAKWYDAMYNLDHPTVIIYLKEDGSGQIRYDFISTHMRHDHKMKKLPLIEELKPIYYGKNLKIKTLKTKIDKDCYFNLGAMFGEAVFTAETQNEILSIVIKHIESNMGRKINCYGKDKNSMTLSEILTLRMSRIQ